MVTRRKDPEPLDDNDRPRRPPATTPEAREQQLIAMAFDLVEKRILNGTATSQETTHFLKLGAEETKLQREKLRNENELLKARKEQINQGDRMEKLLEGALRAFKGYSGEEMPTDEEHLEH